MLAFGELLGSGIIGELKLLRIHLMDIYDFAFLQTVDVSVDSVPSAGLADTLHQQGSAELSGNRFIRYGIGEFKALGESILDDFDPADSRKAPDTPDLLVCWSFDQSVVEDGPWTVETPDETSREFESQTHVWNPIRGDISRSRPLPVIALETLITNEVRGQRLGGCPEPWPDRLPNVYF